MSQAKKTPDGYIIWKKVEFVLKEKVLFTAQDCTLPEAVAQAAQLKPMNNFQMSIKCYYGTE